MSTAAKRVIQAKDIVLFQGDSITDCGRNYQAAGPNDGLGQGYVQMAAAELLARRPADGLRFLNRGISGNRIVDLYARIKCDCINLAPNVLSILVGVNDTWHEFGGRNGVAVPKYERIYRAFLEEVREALPSVRLVLCEPFVVRCGVVAKEWIADIDQRRAVVRGLANEFGAVLVPFQKVFDQASTLAPPEYWSADGVHPSAAGHWIMADAWLKAVS